MRQLLPASDADADLDALYGAPRPVLTARPWVAVCMITSLDGSTAVEGRSGGLGNAGDAAVFGALRRMADLILVGATTAAVEQYGPPRRRDQRIGVVTASGRVDTSSDLFGSGAGFLVMPEDGPPAPSGVEVLRAGRQRVDIATALGRLGSIAPGARFVLAEGGATLNGALVDAGCVDELDITVAPLLTGGDVSGLTVGANPTRQQFRLAHLLCDEEAFVFTRWVRAGQT